MSEEQNIETSLSFRVKDAKRRRTEFIALKPLLPTDWRKRIKIIDAFYQTHQGAIRLDNIRDGGAAPSDTELIFFRGIVGNGFSVDGPPATD